MLIPSLQFTIVIPLYNKGKHVKRTIQSVFSQTCQNFEIIVVDDGSTDDGPAIVEQIDDGRVRLLRQKNSGVSSARNHGARVASGAFLTFLDADDVWEPSFLEEMLRLIGENPEGGAYGSDWYFERNGTRTTHRCTLSDGVTDFFKGSVHRSVLWTSATVVPKKVFESVGGFDERLSHGEDIDLWFRIANSFAVFTVSKYLAVYVLDSDNRACLKRGVDVRKRFPHYIPPYGALSNPDHQLFYYKYIIIFLVDLVKEGNLSGFFQYLNRHFSGIRKVQAVAKVFYLLPRTMAANHAKNFVRS